MNPVDFGAGGAAALLFVGKYWQAGVWVLGSLAYGFVKAAVLVARATRR